MSGTTNPSCRDQSTAYQGSCTQATHLLPLSWTSLGSTIDMNGLERRAVAIENNGRTSVWNRAPDTGVLAMSSQCSASSSMVVTLRLQIAERTIDRAP